MSYTRFLGRFPIIDYNSTNQLYGPTQAVTDIFFRVALVKETISNIDSYFVYALGDDDTPDILADKTYGDSGAFWMILYANDMVDPTYDWPLTGDAFASYLAEKYRSSANSASISSVTINSGGLGYSNTNVGFTGGFGNGATATLSVDSNGVIQKITMITNGTGYYMSDIVNANLSGAGGLGANLSVVIDPPSDNEVIDWTEATIHHYEKIIDRLDSATGETTTTTFTVDKSISTNGILYLASANGNFIHNETVFVGNTVTNSEFSATVSSWNNANGMLVITNQNGDLIIDTIINGNTSFASANILSTSFVSEPYDYFDGLAAAGSYKIINYSTTGTIT